VLDVSVVEAQPTDLGRERAVEREEISKRVRREAAARMEDLLARGRHAGEIACPNWPEDHIATIVELRDGRQVVIWPECGYEETH